jgi:prolyl-tRNA synthetase
MKASQFLISTLKEAPSDAEIISHQLMMRAGLIKKLAGGIYTYMPMGLRVIRKVEAIVREEMNRAGAMELLMPAVQPAELWQESGRWEKYGAELLRLKDRHDREFVIGPTHEEVITDVARREIKSYKQLPLNFYQIQTKFRDEIRPRFGVMRGREFIMKDAYSFHADFASLEKTYQIMYATYSRIFERLGLKYRAVAADTGSIGGEGSHEFHVLADSGEDAIAYCPTSDYAANVELAEAVMPQKNTAVVTVQDKVKVATPTQKKCEEVAALLHIELNQIIKTLVLVTIPEVDAKVGSKEATPEQIVVLLRADHELNEIKLQKIIGEFRFASDEEVRTLIGCEPGFIGPVGLPNEVKCYVDRAVAVMVNAVCGANEAGFHFTNVNLGKDFPVPESYVDIRNVVTGDTSPDGKGVLELCRGIEVGHIFQLRTKYAEALKCQFLNEQGKSQIAEMGCYGIGVSRIVGACIEQNFDERGIVFPKSMAPFVVAICPMGMKKSARVAEVATKLYDELLAKGVDVLLDDRDERPGAMFADMELLGIPLRITVGERTLENGQLELQVRRGQQASLISAEHAVTEIMEALSAVA